MLKHAQYCLLPFVWLASSIIVPLDIIAQPKFRSNSQVLSSASGVSWAKRVHQGFSMQVWLSNQLVMGIEAWGNGGDDVPPEPTCGSGLGLDYPAGTGSCMEHLFGAGPMVGAIVNGVRRVSQAYSEDGNQAFAPRRIDTARSKIWYTSINDDPFLDYNLSPPRSLSTTVNRRIQNDDGDGKIDEDELDGLDNDGDWNPITDDVGADGLPDSLEASCDGQLYDPVTNPDPAQDNYDAVQFDKCRVDPITGNPLRKNDKNHYTESNGIPDHGEPHVDEDYGAVSDRDFYTSSTDTVTGVPGVPATNVPMGAKISAKTYAWREVDGTVFLDYSFIDIGRNTWTDTYVGMFADMDVGPINVSGYYFHNYAAYDSLTHTAYIANPIDRGSTPLGLTFLGASKPLDSLQFIFQWFNTGELGSDDSITYTLLSGNGPFQLIKPNQSPTNPTDSKVLLSLGPFQMQPGDSVNGVFAFVSGMTIKDMLIAARRAHRLYESRYFVSPVVHIDDHSSGAPVRVFWDAVQRSPYGPVVSYRLYHGTAPGIYTDTLATDSLGATVSGLLPGPIHYFAVAAIDDKGNRSALSDEVSTSPGMVRNVIAASRQLAVQLQWTPNSDLDLAGYNIYRHSSLDSIDVKLNPALIDTAFYLDEQVWGDRTYYYKITSVDMDGHESQFSDEASGHLIPPAAPSAFIIGPGKTFLHLNWAVNKEGDLAGYNIYRSTGGSNYVMLNGGLWHGTDYVDSALQQGADYSYYLEAVDTTSAVSTPSSTLIERTATMSEGILVMNLMDYPGSSLSDSARTFYNSLLQKYKHSFFAFTSPFPPSVDQLARFSSVIWLYERMPPRYSDILPIGNYPGYLKAYLLGGGKLLFMGRKLTISSFPHWFNFLRDIFGVNALTEIDSTASFVGAEGALAFPSLQVDSLKLISTGGRMNYVERFPGADSARVLYRYISDPFDSIADGKPVGLRALDTTMKAYYMSFPLYYLDSSGASSMLARVLNDFNEVIVDIRPETRAIPKSYYLYDPYPNPFNPSTKMEFDVPAIVGLNITIFDMLGREVVTLVDARREPGHYEISWDAGQQASGVYFCRMSANTDASKSTQIHVETKKLLLMK